MSLPAHDAVRDEVNRRLPRWWRCLLVVAGTIILSSCTAPVAQVPLCASTNAPAQQDLPATSNTTPVSYEITDCQPEDSIHCDSGHECGATMMADPYGPLVGPSDEYLCDGGDFGSPAGVQEDWIITGLEEEDAVGHYDTLDGRTMIVPSNRVCIYAPRFAAVRRVVSLVEYQQPRFINMVLDEASPARAETLVPPLAAKQRLSAAADIAERPASLFRQRQQAGGLENLQATMDAYTSLAAYANLTVIRTGEVSNAETARLRQSIQSAIAWTGVQAPQVVFGVKMAQVMQGVRQPGIVYHTDEPNHPRLRLIKLASCGHALPGEEVEFTLRFDNIGDQVIGNVTIVDNLSGRLEYVPNSATSSVDAKFLTEPNASGSNVLRWEIKDPVEPGTGGILRFRTRVR